LFILNETQNWMKTLVKNTLSRASWHGASKNLPHEFSTSYYLMSHTKSNMFWLGSWTNERTNNILRVRG
jgi:hypothetical protein